MSREEHHQKVLRAVEDDLIRAEDGYFVFWPMHTRGFLRPGDLRIIADELDKRNRLWHDKVVRDLDARRDRA